MKNLPKGARRLCGALLELSPTGNEVYSLAINTARQGVGTGYTTKAEPTRGNLIAAIELNIINQKKYPYHLLKRKYGLLESEKQFRRQKDGYCKTIINRLSINNKNRADNPSK